MPERESGSGDRVQGVCVGCGRTTLFLGDGGYVTCSWAECPDPTAPDRILHRVYDLAMVAARAIMTASIANSKLTDHVLHQHENRKQIAAQIGDLRELMGTDWVARECGWPEL